MRAACGRVDFFPARGESVRDAKAVCAGCPVRSECLDFALRLKVAHGVWGGLSERERRTFAATVTAARYARNSELRRPNFAR